MMKLVLRRALLFSPQDGKLTTTATGQMIKRTHLVESKVCDLAKPVWLANFIKFPTLPLSRCINQSLIKPSAVNQVARKFTRALPMLEISRKQTISIKQEYVYFPISWYCLVLFQTTLIWRTEAKVLLPLHLSVEVGQRIRLPRCHGRMSLEKRLGESLKRRLFFDFVCWGTLPAQPLLFQALKRSATNKRSWLLIVAQCS